MARLEEQANAVYEYDSDEEDGEEPATEGQFVRTPTLAVPGPGEGLVMGQNRLNSEFQASSESDAWPDYSKSSAAAVSKSYSPWYHIRALVSACSNWKPFSYKRRVKFMLYVILPVLNIAITITLNAIYLYIILNFKTTYDILAQTFLLTFKLLWNVVLIPTILRSLKANKTMFVRKLAVQMILLIFNIAVAPVLASMIANSDCLFYLFSSPPSVTTHSKFEVCYEYLSDGQCLVYFSIPIVTTFTPPFLYSFQCASSILQDYVPVFTEMYALLTVGYPIFIALLVWVLQKPSFDVLSSSSVVIDSTNVPSPSFFGGSQWTGGSSGGSDSSRSNSRDMSMFEANLESPSDPSANPITTAHTGAAADADGDGDQGRYPTGVSYSPSRMHFSFDREDTKPSIPKSTSWSESLTRGSIWIIRKTLTFLTSKQIIPGILLKPRLFKESGVHKRGSDIDLETAPSPPPSPPSPSPPSAPPVLPPRYQASTTAATRTRHHSYSDAAPPSGIQSLSKKPTGTYIRRAESAGAGVLSGMPDTNVLVEVAVDPRLVSSPAASPHNSDTGPVEGSTTVNSSSDPCESTSDPISGTAAVEPNAGNPPCNGHADHDSRPERLVVMTEGAQEGSAAILADHATIRAVESNISENIFSMNTVILSPNSSTQDGAELMRTMADQIGPTTARPKRKYTTTSTTTTNTTAGSMYGSSGKGRGGSPTGAASAVATVAVGGSEIVVDKRNRLLNPGVVISHLVTHLALLLTFGAVYPPLAAVVVIAVIVITLQWQILVGRYLFNLGEMSLSTMQHKLLLAQLERSCNGVRRRLFHRTKWILLVLKSLFYILFAIDMTAYRAPQWREWIWAPLSFALYPLLLFAGQEVFLLRREIYAGCMLMLRKVCGL